MTAYLHARKLPLYLTGLFLLVFITIEIIFFSGNVLKIVEGGWFTLVTGLVLFSVMWTWRRARRIKKRYERLTEIEEYFPLLTDLSEDRTVAKYASNLVYLTSANFPSEVEDKIMYSDRKSTRMNSSH